MLRGKTPINPAPVCWHVQVNVGLFDQAKEALSNAQDSLPGGGAVDDAKQAASGTASEASRCVPLLVSL